MNRKAVAEWIVTLGFAIVFVLAFEAEVAQPFRVPTSSMEPTLACAHPGLGCTATFNDRVIVAKIVYRFRDPRRGEIAVFHAPAAAKKACSEGGTYLKRVVGLPGDKVSERNGFMYIDGKKLSEPYVTRMGPGLGDEGVAAAREERVLHDGRQPDRVVRLAHMGPGRAVGVHRPGRRDVLAAAALDGSLIRAA